MEVREGLLILEKGNDQHSEQDMTLEENFEFMQQVLVFALTQSLSEYWPDLALKWMMHYPETITKDALDALNVACDRLPKSAQSFKHRAGQLIRAYRS